MINIYGKGDHAKVVSSSIRLQKFKFAFHHGHFYDESWISYLLSGSNFPIV